MKTLKQFFEDTNERTAMLRQQQQQSLQKSIQNISAQKEKHNQFLDTQRQEHQQQVDDAAEAQHKQAERERMKDELKREIKREMG